MISALAMSSATCAVCWGLGRTRRGVCACVKRRALRAFCAVDQIPRWRWPSWSFPLAERRIDIAWMR